MFRRKISKKGLAGQKGQAITMVVIMMSGMLLMATTVAGLLMFYQVQSSTSFGQSAKAIYAADSGLEAAIYYYFYEFDYSNDRPCPASDPCKVPSGNLPSLNNGATLSAEMVVPPPSSGSSTKITAKGESGRTIRLLQTTFE